MPGISKNSLFQFCEIFVTQRIARLHGQIGELGNALTTETKSSAGDKHETGRAMLQLEREKLGKQLLEAEKMQQVLQKVSLAPASGRVVLGSLVQTDKASYYIAISAGKCEIGTETVFCISAQTPLAQRILGKTVGDRVEFNQNEQTILNID